ncbi:MAG: HAMP domain-containing protein, partial [Candidatus Omnitrophica bacterium]|nr:HAMP domain-containing protein [Candidatus Omnitrophota bacterium]
MKNASIQTKIGILVAIFLIEVFFLTSLLFFTIRTYETSVSTFSRELEKLELTKDLQVALANVIMPANDFLISGSETNEMENFRRAAGNLERLFTELAKKENTDNEEKKLLAQVEKEYLQGKKIALKIFNLPDVIREREGGQLMEAMDKVIIGGALSHAERFHEYARQRMLGAKKDTQGASKTIVFVILAIVVFNVFFVVVFVIFFKRAIVAPIARLHAATLEVMAGNLNKKIAISSNNEIGQLSIAFNEMVERRKTAEEELKTQHQNQSILNDLLKISLENIPFKEMLEKIIDRSFSIPWFFLEKKGGIFLIEDNGQFLKLKAHVGLPVQIQEMCKEMPLGKCLCGRAALSGHIEFASSLDAQHTSVCNDMPAQGRYCVPIMSADKKCLGVINFCLQEGRQDTPQEREFLSAIANVLAGIIERRLADESLQKAYKELRETQEQVIQGEKFKAIGQLASGIAHEVRNPLAIIMQSADYLEIKLNADKEITEVAHLIKDNIKRADNIICALVDFSKVTQLELEPLNINPIIENSLLLIPQGFMLENVEVVRTLEEHL